MVRPYPQVQAHGQPQATPQSVPIQSGTPVTVAAPSVHLPQGQPAVLTDGQMKVMCCFCSSQLKLVQYLENESNRCLTFDNIHSDRSKSK